MTTTARMIVLALAAAVMFPLTASAAAGAASPEAAFENYKAAKRDKDFKAEFNSVSPESRDIMLGGMAVAMNLGLGLDPAKAPEAQKLVEKYGIKKVDPTKATQASEQIAMLKESVADVKDKPACFAELMNWMETNSANQNEAERKEVYNSATLTDLKKQDTSASGTIKIKHGDKEGAFPVQFKKIGDSWYIDMAGGDGGGGGGAPQGQPAAPNAPGK